MFYEDSFKNVAVSCSSHHCSWMISAVSGAGRAAALWKGPATKDSCWRKQHQQASSSIQCEACRVDVRRLLSFLNRVLLNQRLQLLIHDVTMPTTQSPTNAKLLTNMSLSLSNILFIIFFLFASFTDTVSARNTLLIVGHSSNNVYKMALAEQLIHNFSHINIDFSKEFTVFHKDEEQADMSDDWNQNIGGVQFREENISRLVVSKMGTDQMSLMLISHFYQFAKTENPMIVVEIGNEAIQTRALLTKGTLCWGITRAQISSPNIAYLCNEVHLAKIGIIDSETVTAIGEYDEYTFKIRQPEKRLWPCIFASALKTDKKHKQKHVDIVAEEEVEDMVDKIMEDITDKKYENNKKENEADDRLHTHKLHCKYRKSCYETGDIPHIEEVDSLLDRMGGWFSNGEDEKEEENTEVQLENLDRTDLDGDGIPDSEDDDLNLTPFKFMCKYRLRCYKEYGIPLSKADVEQEERRSMLTRSAPQTGKKKTLKDIAERTVKKVKEAEEKAASRPMSKAATTERILDEIEEKLAKKLNCKYRKSCYETGSLPEIDLSYHIPLVSNYWSKTVQEETKLEKEQNIEDMEEIEKKVYCKYRRSCYNSGVKPVIEPEIQINSIRDLRELPDMIETRKLTIQERCKYRKSCYESGILPDLHAHQMDKVILKEVSSVIPTSVMALKELCKYRKSCYQEIAESATIDTVKHIRKRRLIEREVRKRALRRARLRRKLKIDVEDRHSHHRRTTKKEKKADRSRESIEETVKPIKQLKRLQVHENDRSAEKPLQNDLENLQEPEVKRKKKVKKVKTPEPVEQLDKDVKPVIKPKKLKNIPKNDAESDTDEKTKRGNLKKTKQILREEQQDDKPYKEEPTKKIKQKKENEPAEVLEQTSETAQPIKEKKSSKNKKPEEISDVQETVPKATGDANIVDDDWKHSKKEKCKYRRSCYASGEAPIIDQSVASLFNSFTQHVDSEYDRESNIQRSEADHKLDCKYRKSCYETGKLPDLTITAEMITSYEFYEFRDGITARKLRCKYRKSCYEDQGIDDGPERMFDQEEVRKPTHKTLRKEKGTNASRDKKSEKTKQKDNAEDGNEDDDDTKKEKTPKILYPAKETHASSELRDGEKNDCKYRKSCYQGVEPRAKNEDHSGTIARTEPRGPLRTKCNVYYLSCREQMGLPLKEEAPMGPNGRRLCRKKKD